jgi:hypothetical protein
MFQRSCPNTEQLLEGVSIPGELPFWSHFLLKTHVRFCAACEQKQLSLKSTWEAYFQPDPEVATSVLKVYSRLQKDETLILKGWKLGDFRNQKRDGNLHFFLRTWGFPTGIAAALGVSALFYSPAFQTENGKTQLASRTSSSVPLSQVRVREKNSVKVHYVQPELIHSMEFETVSNQP